MTAIQKFLFTITVLFFTGGDIYSAPEPSVNAAISPLKGTVGQPFIYTVSIKGIDSAALKIILPEKKIVYPIDNKEKKNSGDDEKSPSEFVPLYIINNASRNDSDTNGITINLSLTYYRPGNYTMPEIKISGKDGISIGYKIPSVIIEAINTEGIFEEIEPPMSLSGNHTRLIWIIIAVIVIAAAVFFLYRYLKKKRKPLVIEETPLPPIKIFLNEVENLKLKNLIAEGKINEYVFGISIIFRRYLSLTLNFDAAEMTTDEISSKIKKFMPPEIYSVCGDEIISNMRLWDLSKFAEFVPSQELLLNNLEATVSVAKKISEMKGAENVSAGV